MTIEGKHVSASLRFEGMTADDHIMTLHRINPNVQTQPQVAELIADAIQQIRMLPVGRVEMTLVTELVEAQD